MNKKILITIGILAFCIILTVGLMKLWEKPEFGTCKTDEDCRNVRCVGAYCDNGICKCPPGGTGDLSRVKVASVYQKLMNKMQIDIGRTTDDTINILKETKTDFIFRAWWRWSPCPETCDQLPQHLRGKCESNGYSYAHLQNAISEIKAEIPNIIITGAVPAQKIDKNLWNPVTGEVIRYPKTWDMAFDPSEWGFTTISKTELQCKFAERYGYMGENTDCNTYDPAKATAYFPDITNPEYRELLKAFIEKQIQTGCDGIWIDLLYTNIRTAYILAGEDEKHPAVIESVVAVENIVNWFHIKYPDKYIGSWAGKELPFVAPKLDFVTLASFNREEILNMQIDEDLWDMKISRAQSKFPNAPMITFIDSGESKAPMYYFSQELSSEQQSQFLRIADDFLQKKGVIFAYPVHGLYMSRGADTLAYSEHAFYDSLAPEFQTYETIKELAQSKSKE